MKLKHLLPMMALTATTAFAQGLTTGIDKANMNLAVKPGTDFYEYAGGGWMKAHPLTPEFSRYGQFNALDEMNRNRLKSLIEEMAAKQAAPGTLEQKVGALYRLAMDSVRRNREGFTPIKPLLERVAKVEDKQTYFFLVNELGRQGVPAFMSVG